ncbi:MAG: Ni/Fe-hydrogenase, b-type cytochrome subunit [Lutibacter sp.]|nr:Ni/Fe-hydrogenase, b-type cytochrome subunit [Lutibacter sp.]
METRNFQRVYVWELPVRIFHWVNVLCVLALTLSGFLIANPPALLSNAEATNLHSFGIVRYIHFIAAYIFFFNMILRVYWSFVGNQFASWRVLWPFDKKRWGNFKHVIKNDIILMNDKEPELKNISIGHNSVAAFSYLILFIIALISVFTGFALYADTSTWFLPKLFSWVTPMLGGDFMVRNIHHIAMWGFILFTIIHVYLVFFHDWLEGRAEVSSMFGGYKFVREERIKKVKEVAGKK